MSEVPLPPQSQQQGSPVQTRKVPQSELDFELMRLEPEWGRQTVSEDLRAKLVNILGIQENPDTKETELTVEHLWGLLSYYTKDVRLGNISNKNGEFNYCQAYLDFAGDCLREGYIQSFMTALSRVITVLELSQSKDGFLRRRQGTITSEQFQEILEPKKRSFFGNGGGSQR